ncbi:hypothetical protein VF14_11570 [Nostoc linckia z18]|uniref:Uncharacterized protein n=2 Tax=Nostoc linckia TaxID=92942 RepID=A0A9Q6EJX3_NOSLI|nr:hypothetical protein [Nostoc linckia]PHK40906.1 hypothetical protein VF12_08680 [Nostoc linckia z15]PHK46449.1 hypothetical protein VF13_10915 [Nostoc linckia z16]PHJ60249.1 hypothetical protein VF02_23070 [Nostoc linckia z1]PHJ63815.1 hypothetical protein VF05_24035 [Nostoc linckia z3]PHJ70829.1 hypothetical protein VF03_21605 [Nostoc linckia z2]
MNNKLLHLQTNKRLEIIINVERLTFVEYLPPSETNNAQAIVHFGDNPKHGVALDAKSADRLWAFLSAQAIKNPGG